MMPLEFAGRVIYKMTGSGNDFVFVDGRDGAGNWSPEAIRAVCARRVGVGADGLVELVPGSGPGRVAFHFFNADGSRGAMCGNAALCATRLAVFLELAPAEGMILETDAGPVQTRCLSDGPHRAELLLPSLSTMPAPVIPLEPGELSIGFAAVGVEHTVVRVADLEQVPMAVRGPYLRSHPGLGAPGANANFVSKLPEGTWAMRTWERGVEGETLACGTGAVACGMVLAAAGEVTFPWSVRTRSGIALTVSGSREAPRLAGEGRLVYRASLVSLSGD
ncbi:MAG: diaminopimelate epimerase [Gemmatimonadales bacterium]